MSTTKPTTKPRRTFIEITGFGLRRPGGKHLSGGSVRLGPNGEIRLELPGRYLIESFFPGWPTGDKMNITFTPVVPDEEST